MFGIIADNKDQEDSDSDDDDDEDDTAALMRELEKIKQERVAASAAAEKVKDDERAERAMGGNPLLEFAGEGGGVKRRWDDDVVFKNQSRGD